MGVRTPEEQRQGRRRPSGPSLAAAAALLVVLLILLVSNGRPIEAGDTRPTERVAASLLLERDFDLDEYADVGVPFAREVGAHRVSNYPVLSALLAVPVFAVARLVFALDETGLGLAGKAAAALFSAAAAAVLFLAVGRRHPHADARLAAVVLALGTTLWSSSQALWQHPAAVLLVCVAILFLVKAEEDSAWAARAGLPLGLALAARHADVALVGMLALGTALRWPRRLPAFVLWASPGPLFTLAYQWAYFGSPLRHGFSGAEERFTTPWGLGHLGLLISPAKGLFVFTPVALVALVGLVRALRRGERFLPLTLGGAFLAHWLLIGRWREWHGGESWGPRLLADALPPLLLFLPEGLTLLPRLGALLAAASIGVQALGAYAYDLSWERLYQRPIVRGRPELWDLARSPIPFYLERRVVILALPGLREGRATVREHPLVVLGPTGSRFSFEGVGVVVRGADATAGDVHLQRGARVEGGKLRLSGRWDALFLRLRPSARQRRLELRISGRGRGQLLVGERTFWSETRFTAYPMAGAFRIRHPYHYPDSGGPDLTVTVGRDGGEALIDAVALVAQGAPENAIEAP